MAPAATEGPPLLFVASVMPSDPPFLPWPDDADDARLMEATAAGDHAAFRQLVERHQALIVGTVARMLGQSADAEDIAQQVFMRAWKSAGRYAPTAKFTTWLLTIARNLVFNEFRRRSRHQTVPIETETNERPLPDLQQAMPDDALLQRELQTAIDRAIARLPEKQRMAVVLRRYEELSYEEIADVLELSVPAVKSVLFRARTELRESLSQYLNE